MVFARFASIHECQNVLGDQVVNSISMVDTRRQHLQSADILDLKTESLSTLLHAEEGR